MSSLGYQTVMRLFSEQAGVCVERAFVEESKAHELSGRESGRKSGWHTIESGRSLGDCDILAFSVAFEGDYPNVLAALNAAGVLSKNAPERQGGPLLLAGGTALSINPEPLADFFDVIALGEAEEFIAELMAAIRSTPSESSRDDLLKRIAQIEGAYVPGFYRPCYAADGRLEKMSLTLDWPQMPRPKRRFLKDLSTQPANSIVLAKDTEFSGMFLTEVSRGCESACRFCAASYAYRPVRKREPESVLRSIEEGLKHCQAIGLVGAAVSSHPEIVKFAEQISSSGARAALSSVMSQRVTPELAGTLAKSDYKTVALAPETGSDELRKKIGKRVSNKQIVEAAITLAQSGIFALKLYFMLGLPEEKQSDIEALVNLVAEIREAISEIARAKGKKAKIALSVNAFIPKAGTPFQWEPMQSQKEIESKLEFIKKKISAMVGVELRSESARESVFQALLSRGDRRVGDLLLSAAKASADWKWVLKEAAALEIGGVSAIEFFVERRFGFDEVLPWDHIDNLVDKNILRRENESAHS